MARARGDGTGGITGLVALIERDGGAIDAELQARYGLSLGDVAAGRLTWRRLRDLLEWLPIDGTALWRKHRRNPPPDAGKWQPTAPPDEYWTPDRHMQADLIDIGNLLLWSKTKDATHGRNRPKPIPRPGVDTGEKRYGTPMSAARVLQLLRPEPEDEPAGASVVSDDETDDSPSVGVASRRVRPDGDTDRTA